MARNPSHNIKLLFADLDGTLLDGRSELTAESRRAARECAAAGIAVVVATARPPR
ncbi:MAG: HAD hydrolase family protein, partial [Planctomycetes bacterium]|nr:HAD hydrolase family protein [Planctomycetota bacterium]